MGESQQYDYMAKTLIIGDSGVGKTSIIKQLTHHEQVHQHAATIGLEFGMKNYQFEDQNQNKKNILLQLWDTAGSEQYNTLTNSFFKGAHIIIMAYSVNDRKTFDNIKNQWMPKTDNHTDNKNIVTYLVGNKLDLQDQRQVQQGEAMLFQQKQFDGFMEISSKRLQDVEELFNQIIKIMKQKIEQKTIQVIQTNKNMKIKKVDNGVGCGRQSCNQC